jgi:hypothetical protein
MFKNPFLFHALGTDWRLSKFCVACGLAVMLIGVLFFVALAFHTKAHWRRLSSADAANVAFHGSSGRGEVLPATTGVGVAGAEIQLTMDIDGLRRAARRGDWMSFFLWPISMSCWIIGTWLVFTAFLLYTPPGFWVMVSIFLLGMEGITLFMPYAAIFTNIDAGVDGPAGPRQQKSSIR